MDEEDNIELPETIAIPEGMIDENEISDYLSEQTGYPTMGLPLLVYRYH